MEGNLYFGKNFIDLYLDSLVLLQAAHEDYKTDSHSCKIISFCRGAIISALISMECAANCCLSVLELQKHIKNEVDKLDFIAKFHHFNMEYPTPHDIDFSKVEVGRVVELKKIRNDYVHPKVLRGELEKVSENHFRTKFNKKHYPLTGLSCDPTTWDITEAVKVCRAITDFYNYYFLKVCEFTPRMTSAILVGDEEFNRDNPRGVNFGWVKTFPEVKADFDISADFLGAI